jgi:hypothetical protein
MCASKLARFARYIPELREDQRLSFILEDGHKNLTDAVRIFQEMKTGYLRHVLGNFATAAKQDYGAVQAADLIAYGAYQSTEQHLRTESLVEVSKSFAAVITSAPIDDVWVTRAHLDTLADIQIAERRGDKETAQKAFDEYMRSLPDRGGLFRLPEGLKYHKG